MKQFLLCLAMLICSIFMYVLVTFLEKASLTQKILNTKEGSITEFGIYQR